jgi:hypothetical protein
MQDNLVELWREQSPTIFFITHSIEEAVFLGDHILLFSNSPGTVLKTIRVPPPDRPSIEMQRDPKFQEVVTEIRDVIDRLESSTRAGDLAMAEPKKAGLFRYLKEAFMFRWNLLVFGGCRRRRAVGPSRTSRRRWWPPARPYLAGSRPCPVPERDRCEGRRRGARARPARRTPAVSRAAGERSASASSRCLEVADRGPPRPVPEAARALRRDVEDRERRPWRHARRERRVVELRQPALDRLLGALPGCCSPSRRSRAFQAADEAGIDKTLGELKVRRKKRADSVGEANQPTTASSARSTTASRRYRAAQGERREGEAQRRVRRRRARSPREQDPGGDRDGLSATPIPNEMSSRIDADLPRASRRPSRRSASCSRSPASAMPRPHRRSSTPIYPPHA